MNWGSVNPAYPVSTDWVGPPKGCKRMSVACSALPPKAHLQCNSVCSLWANADMQLILVRTAFLHSRKTNLHAMNLQD